MGHIESSFFFVPLSDILFRRSGISFWLYFPYLFFLGLGMLCLLKSTHALLSFSLSPMPEAQQLPISEAWKILWVSTFGNASFFRNNLYFTTKINFQFIFSTLILQLPIPSLDRQEITYCVVNREQILSSSLLRQWDKYQHHF